MNKTDKKHRSHAQSGVQRSHPTAWAAGTMHNHQQGAAKGTVHGRKAYTLTLGQMPVRLAAIPVQQSGGWAEGVGG